MGEMKNRKQIGINLPHDMVDKLRAYSASTGIPISRIVEKALAHYFTDTVEH